MVDAIKSDIGVGYIVNKSGSTYYVKDGVTGKVVSSSSNPYTEIQYAMNNLSAGRTWQEEIIIKGDITLPAGATLAPPSYTKIKLYGKITRGTNVAATPIMLSSGVTKVTLEGGWYYGYKAGQTDDSDVIRFESSSFIDIDGITANDAKLTSPGITYGNNICLLGCSDSIVQNCYSYDADYDCIRFRGGTVRSKCLNNIMVTGTTSTVQNGIQVSTDGSDYNQIIGNRIHTGYSGTARASITLHRGEHTLVEGNYIYATSVAPYGIRILDSAWDNTISNNYIYGANPCILLQSFAGTVAESPSYNHIFGNHLFGTKAGGAGYPYGVMFMEGNYNEVHGNMITDCTRAVYLEAGAPATTGNRLFANVTRNCTSFITDAGIGTINTHNDPV